MQLLRPTIILLLTVTGSQAVNRNQEIDQHRTPTLIEGGITQRKSTLMKEEPLYEDRKAESKWDRKERKRRDTSKASSDSKNDSHSRRQESSINNSEGASGS
jgi:transketolase